MLKQRVTRFFRIIQSVLAAMVGIQSDKNREKDFENGNIGSYVFAAITVVVIFIFTLILIVNFVVE